MLKLETKDPKALASLDWKRTLKKFIKAIELNPSYVTAHHWYAEYLPLMGRMNEA